MLRMRTQIDKQSALILIDGTGSQKAIGKPSGLLGIDLFTGKPPVGLCTQSIRLGTGLFGTGRIKLAPHIHERNAAVQHGLGAAR